MVPIITTMKAMAMRRFNFTIKGFLRVAFRVESAIHAGALVAISFAKSALVAAVLLIALFLFNANPAVVQFSDFLRFIQAPAFGLYTFFIVLFLRMPWHPVSSLVANSKPIHASGNSSANNSKVADDTDSKG
ncbi:hypothetical protein MMZ75_32700 (plasmid) [Pseudomonas aeruginosa]|nr:hypothetical protein [Pseudomonas aeruginosa]MCR7874159.1 hypothetical protein [Pseudomonas aeruginosa]OWG38432.1 hypothetical protein CAQ69_09805 [Stutzerimonas stutzeri]UTN36172.1 hypothetical protein MMZ75_32700 [Pseudomonas aeruginosa]HBP4949421.1 hypothetical protein [Pseudomonas aeruginosa]